MKLVDIIKTKNGLAFLGLNQKLISVHSQRLTHEIPQFNPETNYGQSDFSYKKFVQSFEKTHHTSFSGALNDVRRHCTGTQIEMINVLQSRHYNFDGDFLAINKDGEISYMPYNKVQKIVGFNYAKTGRQKLTIHKFIAKIFKEYKQYTEQQVKEFAEHFRSLVIMDLTVEFVKGEDIGKSYAEVSHVGWAKASCMAKKPEYPPSKFTIYNENCELGLIKNGGVVVGRFLRWTTADGVHYEDNVFYKTNSIGTWYKQRCEKEKILHYYATNGAKLKFPLKRPLKNYTPEERPGYFDGVNFDNNEPVATNRY